MTILRSTMVLAALIFIPLRPLGAPLAGPITNAANSHVYYLLAPASWTASKEEARQLGGELVTINDAAEQAWVYSTFSNHGAVKRHLWIGLYDPNSTQNAPLRIGRMGEFRWISGQPATYRNWSPVEPGNSGGSEECVHLWSPNDPNAGRWNDASWTLTNLLGDPLNAVLEIDPSLSSPAVNPTEPAEVSVAARPIKIEQLVGNFDRELQTPTRNQTATRYALPMTDLGVPFVHDGKTFVAFGDVPAATDRDPIAWTTDTNLDDGLELQFMTGSGGRWQPITIPGITLETLEVPVEAVSLNNHIYLWATTDHSAVVEMGSSVLARSSDSAVSWQLLRTFSERHFINVSAVLTPGGDWPGVPDCSGQALFLFGAGDYRKSNVRLAWLPADGIENTNSIRYFTGLRAGLPSWSEQEIDAAPLFDQPVVGELSVAWNAPLRRWLMLYNAPAPRGINYRTAVNPWGPWSETRVLFDPRSDNGYCHFIHSSWAVEQCDSVHDSGQENTWGGEYGPYMFKHLATTLAGGQSRIYFTMSTWNPYTVVLMRADLQRETRAIPRPTLKASLLQDNLLALEWPQPSYGWSLQNTETPEIPASWTANACEPVESLSSGTLRVTTPTGERQRFYRLLRP